MAEAARGGRTRAREVAFRAIFEAEASGEDPLDVLELSLGRFRFTPDGRSFALRLARSVGERAAEVDTHLADLLEKWSIARLSSVVRAILRLAVAELIDVPESPSRVIIMESVRLADRYGEEDAGTFVNGIVDAAARRIRPGSLDGAKPSAD
jgi:N utilization substance protein B